MNTDISPGEARQIANAYAKFFIQRRDVKAVQSSTGSWRPIREVWTRQDLLDHVSGKSTYGHYILDSDSKCKLFVLDIDLNKTGVYPEDPANADLWDQEQDRYVGPEIKFNPRNAWRDRSHPARSWIKFQINDLAHKLVNIATNTLEIPALAAYSGNKGFHVYGFTGVVSADLAREGAQVVLDTLADEWEYNKGAYYCNNKDTVAGFPNFSIEVYPKQDSLDGKDLGNLIRLPLGRNRKTSDPTFFMDLTTQVRELVPMTSTNAVTFLQERILQEGGAT